VEITSVPEGRDDAIRVPLVVHRSGQETSGQARIPIDGLAPGRRTFRARCLLDGGDHARVAGPGRAVDEVVCRARELRWALRHLPLGLGATKLVIESEDLSGLERIRLVGKVNERPTSAEDGRCLLDWRPTDKSPALRRLVTTLGAPRDPRGEIFCRLFIEPANLIRIDDPPVDRTVL
jgi:hypothetical protein